MLADAMGIFNDMITSIVGHPPTLPSIATPTIATPTIATPTIATPTSAGSTAAATGSSPTQAPPAATPPAATAVRPEVDVAEVLDGLAKKNREKLDWKKSIVDLMKLVGIDSSLSARKELAKELNYTGDTGDSAKMNMWLHKEVLRQLAANGGKVPASLID